MSEPTKTLPRADARRVPAWKVEVTAGPGKGRAKELAAGTVRIGSAPDNELVIEDPGVSRHHVVIAISPEGARVDDAGSKNGTFCQGSRITSLALSPAGGTIRLGNSEVVIAPADARERVRASDRESCGRLLGRNLVMRQLFATIERIATTPATVLISGETGSGKELVAEAIHEHGPRAASPFEVLNCGAIPRELVESELFGHVRGAFSGATANRHGAFKRAHGGTLFLDEIGELELSLQPNLLRVLETGVFKPVGADESIHVDVRIIAATNRDLASEVRAGRFREDLYYRLAVVSIAVPPLRSRLEDLPLLADALLKELGAAPLSHEAIKVLLAYSWPGNVRQLRNVLERAAAMAAGGPISVRQEDLEAPSSQMSPGELLGLPFKDAKEKLLARFTRDYLSALLARNNGNVSAAAREAQIDRNWIVALAQRHGLRTRE